MSVQYKKRLFNVDEYHQMISAGILKEDDRVELIDGEIISMPPIGPWHASEADRLTANFYFKFGSNIIVRVQSPVQLNDFTEPQPDIAILKPNPDFYVKGHPKSEDILLLIEIADTTIDYDRNKKIPNYAKSNIIETWLIDKEKNRIEAHREPNNGIYQQIRIFLRGQQINSISFPDTYFSVDELLG
jgi:Uma2 family endonuclease